MGDATDEALMAAYVLEEDRSAYETLFRRYAPRLRGFFLRSVGDEQVALDLVQKTFLHVHRARKDFRQGSRFKPWLYTIATNVKRELYRRRRRKPETSLDPDQHPMPTSQPEASTATERAVRRALQQLPDGQREVVMLHWYEGWSFGEIAEMVGASRSAVKVRAHRAYKVLRDILGEPAEP